MRENILIVGSGAREHCLAWKLSQSDKVSCVYVAPGNAGTLCKDSGKISAPSGLPPINDYEKLAVYCKEEAINLVVVGPEVPLAEGIADTLKEKGISCFGPCSAEAKIEASKLFAKDFMLRHSIPTAKYKSFTDVQSAHDHIRNAPYPALVVKASGLAAGKGVVVARDCNEACAAVDLILKDKHFGDAGSTVIIEERLQGEEISVLCFTDGSSIQVMPPARDHKQLLDGDCGPNTGGMGAYCPCPEVSSETLHYIKDNILQKAVSGMRDEGGAYVGVLYAGLMMTVDGPKVLEFNCRFGDPECQVILPLMESDLYQVMQACVKGNLSSVPVCWSTHTTAVAIVMASSGYPGSYAKGKAITGIENAECVSGVRVFQAGTKYNSSGQLETSGGRVLSVVGCNNDLQKSLSLALEGTKHIKFEGSFHRNDIAARGIGFLKKTHMTYVDAGVSIASGDALINHISPIAKKTARPGCTPSLGGFGGIFDLNSAGYEQPVLVSGSDGVGTKLMIAHSYNSHATVGVDLVAMCVNDILTHNAEPLFFLDYFACGKLLPDMAKNVVKGIGEGCAAAGCALIGGETAEMPGMYTGGAYDLGGFAVGAYEKGRDQPLPLIETVKEGDVVIGIASSGLHSNGFSLVRKILEHSKLNLNKPAPFDKARLLGDALLTPTAIYCKQLLPVIRATTAIKGIAHITGGGIVGNLCRVLPNNMSAMLDANLWNVQPIFGWLAQEGNVRPEEMLRTFNCGLGMCLVVDQEQADEILSHCNERLISINLKATKIGRILSLKDGESMQVVVNNMDAALSSCYKPVLNAVCNEYAKTESYARISGPQVQREVKNVAVLISGTGTNLQGLIDHANNNKATCPYKIKLVISNKPNAFGVKRADKCGIKTQVLDHKSYKNRESFDKAVHDVLTKADIHFVCLAGFMRILSGWFVSKWKGRVINIHPSLLPLFKGIDAHKQVLEAGVRITGCSVHFVVEEMDAGAIIVQEAVPVHPSDTIESLQERVKLVEHKAYPRALELVANEEARFSIASNAVVWNIKGAYPMA